MKSFITSLRLVVVPAGLIASLALAVLSPTFPADAEFLALWFGATALYALVALALLGRSRPLAAGRRRLVPAVSTVPPTRVKPLAWRIQSRSRLHDRLAA